MKRFLLVFLCAILLFPAFPASGATEKICPSCGWITNIEKAKFCGVCSTALVDRASIPAATSAPAIQVEIGDIIPFGHYEQDGNYSNGAEAIEWLVLDVQNGSALVISKYALHRQPYNKNWEELTWENCPLRAWLNRDFLNTAFSAEEQEMIPTVTVPAHQNPDHRTNPGNDTRDQIFLLSIQEVYRYFPYDSAMKCKPTAYAKSKGAATNSEGFCWWWLRTPGYNVFDTAYVNRHGGVNTDGHYVSLTDFAVRPAMWINLNP